MKPKLPTLLDRKIYKTGQTRGADDDVIYQNRVGRNSTVLIPFQYTSVPFTYPTGDTSYEKGFIVLIPPSVYFEEKDIENILETRNLVLGSNCLIFYETRQDWEKYNPEKLKWEPAQSRIPPLLGNYVARAPATTALRNNSHIIRGFTTKNNKGAGIRLYEYASLKTIKEVRLQLEALYWLTYDSMDISVKNGMTQKNAKDRREDNFEQCHASGLLDYKLLEENRIIDNDKNAICPLCREKISADGFYTRLAQAEGRDVPDLTVTVINLFHINELRYGVFNHKPYNLGWGHHHCNVVTKDSGITNTLEWMKLVIARNNC